MRTATLKELDAHMMVPGPKMDYRLFRLGADVQLALGYQCAVIGGKLARPEVYGPKDRKGLRRSSNDIDMIVAYSDLIPELDHVGELVRIREWDGYALVPESRDVCVSLHTEHSHGWYPPQHFWDDTRMMEVYGKALMVPSPEWAVATKLMTSTLNDRMRRKDSIDAATILMNNQIDKRKLQEIMDSYVCTQCRHGSLLCISGMQSARKNLGAGLQARFEDRFLYLQNAVEESCH